MQREFDPRKFLRWTPLFLLLLTANGLSKEVKPVKVEGVLVEIDDDLFRMLDAQGQETVVHVTDSTRIVEDRKNFFRDPRQFRLADLRSGLKLTVKGYPDENGTVQAEKIQFTNHARKMAIVMDSALEPVDSRLDDLANDHEALQGNVEDVRTSLVRTREDLSRVDQTANQADRTANEALDSAHTAHQRIDANDKRVTDLKDRLSLLNDFFVVDQTTVLFGPGSAQLTAEAKEALDKLAEEMLNSNTLVEVAGFASSDGDETYNRRLSQRRAEAVQRYLIENHGVELRKFVSPFGFGELEPVADNQTHQGREKNRRAEIRVLSSRGLQPDRKAAGPAGGQ